MASSGRSGSDSETMALLDKEPPATPPATRRKKRVSTQVVTYGSNRSTSSDPPSAPDEPPPRADGAWRSRTRAKRSQSIMVTERPIMLSWRNINAYAQIQGRRRGAVIPTSVSAASSWSAGDVEYGTTRHILKNVSGLVKPGALLAILGASGAGKSTLMNILNQRNLGDLIVHGNLCINGTQANRKILAAKSAYVQQDNIFIGLLTVREHLWFQSKLRMDKSMTDDDRAFRVDEVIIELGLSACADTVIGTAGIKKSISGGERKRLAFASEVLTNPALMFCDEPTSGLDSFMAESTLLTLKKLASVGKTIVCTVHQPSSEVFALFDNLLLMADGRVAFLGSTSDAAKFFASNGQECPVAYNPADFYVHTLAIKPGKEQECRRTITSLCESFEKSPTFDEMIQTVLALEGHAARDEDHTDHHDPQMDTSRYRTSWCKQFHVLMWRAWVTNLREPMATRVKLTQAVFAALVIGLIFLQQTYNQKGVMNINGVLFLLQTQCSFGHIFAIVATFPLEYPVYIKDHQDGMYGTGVYYLTKMLAELPVLALAPALFTAVAYWLIGLNPDWQAFLICVGVLILVTNVSASYAYILGCSTNNVTVVTTLLPSLVVPLMIFGGFFLNSRSVPVYFIWLKYISWFSFSNEILVVNQWKSVTNITCEYVSTAFSGVAETLDIINVGESGTSRCFQNGQQVIESLSCTEDNVLTDVYAMLALLVGFRLISFIILLIRARRNA